MATNANTRYRTLLQSGNYRTQKVDLIDDDIYYTLVLSTGAIVKNAYGRDFKGQYDAELWSDIITADNMFPSGKEIYVFSDMELIPDDEENDDIEVKTVTVCFWSQMVSSSSYRRSRSLGDETISDDYIANSINPAVDPDFLPERSSSRSFSQITSLMDNMNARNQETVQRQLAQQAQQIQQLQDNLNTYIRERDTLTRNHNQMIDDLRSQYQSKLEESYDRQREQAQSITTLRDQVSKEYSAGSDVLRSQIETLQAKNAQLEKELQEARYTIKEKDRQAEIDKKITALEKRYENESKEQTSLSDLLGLATKFLPAIMNNGAGAVTPQMQVPMANMVAQPSPVQAPRPAPVYNAPSATFFQPVTNDNVENSEIEIVKE